MVDLAFRSAKQLAADIRRKKIGCLELLETYLARIEKYNPTLNAIVVLDRDGARRRTRAADAALKKGKAWGPLHGVPMTINGHDVLTTDQLFWAGYPGMVSLPGTVAPIGVTPSGLPVGVQIVGPQYADRTTIDFARHLEREYQAFTPPPGYA